MAQRIKTDWVLFLTIVGMVCFGLVMVYSASSAMAAVKYKDANYVVLRQLGWVAVSFIALMFFKRKDYHRLAKPTWAFAPLGVVTAMLVVVYFLDARAHRWLKFGSVGIQPAEFAKPAMIVFLAWFVTRRAHAINTRYTLAPAALCLGLLAGAVIIADLGTAAVLVCTAAAMFYVAGLERRYFIAAVCAGLLVVPLAIVAKPYRLLRVIEYFSFIDPEHKLLDWVDPEGKLKERAKRSNTQDSTYQARQSVIAVATGGVTGLGITEGKQKVLFLPEAHNDFIYAVIGEELGLAGALLVIAGYFVILWRGYRLYFVVPDDFGRYLALGISTAMVVQALMNMSVVLDMAPTKGFPLPLISYGGSSLLSSLSSLGILMSVSDHAG
ncbi:MAG: cell division protein FtsW [Bryobacterales bacterium]|nr:cell division protein FtsW [Bryobacterales bacterium]